MCKRYKKRFECGNVEWEVYQLCYDAKNKKIAGEDYKNCKELTPPTLERHTKGECTKCKEKGAEKAAAAEKAATEDATEVLDGLKKSMDVIATSGVAK